MKPNSRQLALRDTALAAAMGIIGANTTTFGIDRGRQPRFGAEWGSRWGVDSTPAHQMSYNPAHAAMASALAAPGAAAAVPVNHPLHPANIANTMAIVDKHNNEQMYTQNRQSLLHPNQGSTVDIERYDFSLNQTPNLALGTASAIAMSGQPAVTFRPQRGSFNAPSYAFVQISSILSSNVNCLVGGSLDAATYSASASGIYLDLPTLGSSTKLSINGSYSGLVPPGFPLAFSFPFTATFQGPATVVA